MINDSVFYFIQVNIRILHYKNLIFLFLMKFYKHMDYNGLHMR